MALVTPGRSRKLARRDYLCKRSILETYNFNCNILHKYKHIKSYYSIGAHSCGQRLKHFINRNCLILDEFYFILKHTNRYVPNIYRKMIRDMIDYLLYVNNCACNFECISIDNLFVNKGVIIFCGYVLTYDGDPNENNKWNRTRQDFCKLSLLLTSLFRRKVENQKEWPVDLSELLTFMDCYD